MQALNHKIRRRVAALLCAACLALLTALPVFAAAPVVEDDKAVMDHANILSAATETAITNLSVALQESCGAQIGVYTVDYIGNTTMEAYCYSVASAWGLGSDNKDNGVVLLLATGEDDYYMTRGTGLERQLDVQTISDLLYEELEPYWVTADYDGGALNTVKAVTKRLCSIYGLSMEIGRAHV